MAGVLTFGGLDLDDLGTCIGHQHCAVGTREHVREIDNANTGQRQIARRAAARFHETSLHCV
jgi:hypothetical protein